MLAETRRNKHLDKLWAYWTKYRGRLSTANLRKLTKKRFSPKCVGQRSVGQNAWTKILTSDWNSAANFAWKGMCLYRVP